MYKLFAIAKYTIRESIRNKVFYIATLFSVIMFCVAIFLSVLGQEQEKRLLLDFGYILIELIVLLTTLYSSATFLIEEIESKTIYYIFIRNLPRWLYILGRYLGIVCTALISVVSMSTVHLLLLVIKGWKFDITPLYVNFSLLLKISVISAVGLFFAIFSSSPQISFSFTFFFWILGHLSEEIKFVISKIINPITKFSLTTMYYLLPNFQYFNLRDLITPNEYSQLYILKIVVLGGLYCIFYSSIYLSLAAVLLSKREV